MPWLGRVDFTGLAGDAVNLTPVLTPEKGGGLGDGGADPRGGHVIVDLKDHFFVRVAKPPDGHMEVHACGAEVGAVGMPEVMAADGDLPPGREGGGG